MHELRRGTFSTPGHCGGTGVWLYPVATTTVEPVNDSPDSVSTTQLPYPARATRFTWTPVRTSIRWCTAYISR